MTKADLTAIIVNYNTEGLLRDAITRLMVAAAKLSIKIVIVDNASKDNSVALIKSAFPQFDLIANEANVGFGRANNQALDLVEGRYVLLLNTDAFVSPDTIEKTVAYMDKHPHCGILGVKLIGSDGILQPSARYFPTPWNLFIARTGLTRVFKNTRMVDDMTWDHSSVRKCDWVPGCYYLIRKEVIETVGLFDPRYFLYCEEVDHCMATKKAGWDVVCYPYTSVMHIGGESARLSGDFTQNGRQIPVLQIESELLYFRKNHGLHGACLSVILSTLANALIILKSLLSTKSLAGIGFHLKHTALIWSLFKQTNWGSRPTR